MTAAVPDWQPATHITGNAPTLSILVPVYNEEEVLPLFYQRVSNILDQLPHSYELVFVDDGSQDRTPEVLTHMATTLPYIRIVWLSRNFGKEAAVTAGLQNVLGEAVILLDADLQDPPELIPDMVATWQQGFDVVSMQRRSREGETRFKRMSASAFYRLLNRISQVDIPKDTGDFRLMSRRAIDAVNALPERNRYMKGLFAWIGMPTQVLLYDREPRAAGHTKWKFFGLLGLAFEGITSFSTAPLRLLTGLGVISALLGALFGLWIVLKAAVLGDPVPGYPSLVALMSFFGGIQLLTIGLVGEYVGKTYVEAKQRPIYLIRAISQSQLAHASTELKTNATKS